MKKQINATGVNGTFTGEIIVEDMEDGLFKVRAKMEGKDIYGERWCRKNAMFEIVEEIETDVTRQLKVLADKVQLNNDPESIESQLKAKGFV